MNYDGLPDGLRFGTQLWLEQGIQPGSFLAAVICNNLKEAFGRADDDNLRRVHEIVKWFYNECPMRAWGSTKVAQTWAKQFHRHFIPEWEER